MHINEEISKIDQTEQSIELAGDSIQPLAQDGQKIQLKFHSRHTSPKGNMRDNILAMPKLEYQGKDFF